MSEELFPLQHERSNPVNIKQIILKYLQYWYLFLIGGSIGIGAAYFHLKYTLPQYYISGMVLIKDDSKGPGVSGAVLNDLNVSSSKNYENEIIILKSKTLMQKVLTELSFNTSFFIEGRVHDLEIFEGHLPFNLIINKLDSIAFGRRITVHIKDNNNFQIEEADQKITNHKFGQQITKPYGVFTIVASSDISTIKNHRPVIVHFHDIGNLAGIYSSKLSVYPINKEASILQIGLTDMVMEKGTALINRLIEVYNKEAVEDKNLTATNTLDFIDERLKYLGAELSDVEKNVEQFKRQNKVADVSSQVTQYIGEASANNKQISEHSIQIEVLESIENYVTSKENQHQLVPSTLSVMDPTLSGLILKFNELQLDRERMLRTAQPSNPVVQNINEQLAHLRINILENLQNIKSSLAITLRSLQANSGQSGAKIMEVPTIERELLEINRQQEIKQTLYLYLLEKREEAALSLAANVSNSRIIDPPLGYPILPKSSTIYLMALLLGLGIPFAGIYVKDLFDDKIHLQQDVEQFTGTPILGEITLHKTGSVVVSKGNRSPIVEMFALIRAKLRYVAVNKENKVILVTSSMSGEGKTFFSVNLGASLALSGKKVILLEFDFRKPHISKELGLLNGAGITDYLVSDDIMINDLIIYPEKAPDLAVISSGFLPPDPAELILSPKIPYLINKLKESYDHIILDSSPIGLVADAFSLSSVIDSTIFVIRYNYTSKKQISIIENIYRSKSLNQPMIVLNGAKIGASNYGYGYGYGNLTDISKDKVYS